MIALAVLWRELPSQRSYSDKGAYLDVGVRAFKLSGTKLGTLENRFNIIGQRHLSDFFVEMVVMRSCSQRWWREGSSSKMHCRMVQFHGRPEDGSTGRHARLVQIDCLNVYTTYCCLTPIRRLNFGHILTLIWPYKFFIENVRSTAYYAFKQSHYRIFFVRWCY